MPPITEKKQKSLTICSDMRFQIKIDANRFFFPDFFSHSPKINLYHPLTQLPDSYMFPSGSLIPPEEK